MPSIDLLARIDNIERALWGGANVESLLPVLFQPRVTGKQYFLDPTPGYGSDENSGADPENAFATLAAGYGALREGRNDVLYLMSNGLASGSARLTANFTWAKNAAHLIGICAPSRMSQRSRIAPLAGTAAFTNLFTVSGNGCLIKDVSLWDGFSTGTTAQIALTVSGERNVIANTHIAGMADAASAVDAGSRCVKLTGGENVFLGGTIGIDTVARTNANASIEFAGGAPRNYFIGVDFPFWTTDGLTTAVIVAAAAGSDRFQKFVNCDFISAIKSTGVAVAALATLAANMGGMLIFKGCTRVGVTAYGTDATSRGQIFVDGPVASNITGLAVAPNV